MINRDFNSILELMQAFPDEQSCIDHLEALRWNGYVISPFDPLSKVYKCKIIVIVVQILENISM